jgi:hypothetical protein
MGALVLAACVGAGTARADTVAINLAGSINPPGGALPFNYTQGSYLTGFVFRANSAISITQLGFYDSNLTGVPETFVSSAVGVYDMTTNTLLTSATVLPSAPATGLFRYVSISPLTLNTSHTYAIVGVTGTNYYTVGVQASAAPADAAITYVSTAYYTTETTTLVEPNTFSLGNIFGNAPPTTTLNDFGPNFQFTSTAAGPAITSLSPSSAPAGSPTVTVTVSGTGFASGSVAKWNGLSLVTTYVNSTTLTAQITAGDLVSQGTGQITVANPTGPTSNSFPFVVSSGSPLQLLTVAPCRIMDTRTPAAGGTFPANSTFGSPYVAGGTVRAIPIPSSTCGVPASAMAYSLNFTVVPRTGKLGSLTVWPAGQTQPNVSTLTSPDGSVLAAAAIVPAGTAGSINASSTDDTDLVVDINGYFVPPATGTLQFYPLPPCRVLDTRLISNGGSFPPNSTFGSPSLDGVNGRSYPIPSSSCSVPAKAAAYSFNLTAVPQGALGFVTAWPTGQAQPFVSTLNSYDGTVLANAAIVPAGTAGAVSFFASNPTDLAVDINGYFAPPGSGGLNFYTVPPCRLVDTTQANGSLGGPAIAALATRNFPLSQGPCGLPASPALQAYSLSITASPQGPLGYLSTWPAGGTQPFVSTLNGYKGLAVANAAIVPAGSPGSISVFVTTTSNVTIDTAGYFGP